jgi:hypothetical protein
MVAKTASCITICMPQVDRPLTSQETKKIVELLDALLWRTVWLATAYNGVIRLINTVEPNKDLIASTSKPSEIICMVEAALSYQSPTPGVNLHLRGVGTEKTAHRSAG